MTVAVHVLVPAGPLRNGALRFGHDSRQSIRLPRHVRRGQASLHAVIGIDLGTSNSAVGIIDEGEAVIVQTSDGSTTSSLVAFTEVTPRRHLSGDSGK